VPLDDATSELYAAVVVEEEGPMSSLQGLREVIETRGLFSSLYTDRGSHSWYTAAAGGTVDQTWLTQVPRALQQLGGTLIPAYSPEARGVARYDAEGRLIEPEDEAPRRKTPPPRSGDRLLVDPGAMVHDILSAHG
jgi:hypothetical protein